MLLLFLKVRQIIKVQGIFLCGYIVIESLMACRLCLAQLPPELPMLSAEWATGYPELSGDFVKDSSRLIDFKKAGFNTVIFGLTDQEKTTCEYRYQLLAKAGLFGYSQFTYNKIAQNRHSRFNPQWKKSVDTFVSEHKALSPALQARFLGYYLGDEPWPKDRECVDSLISEFRSKHYEKPLFVNIHPYNRVNGVYRDWNDYRDEVEWYFKKIDVVSFDHYPFRDGHWEKWGNKESYYYRSLQLFAEMGCKYNKPFFAFPLASQCEPRLKLDPITKENLMFMAYAPLVYGAKGLVYWHYTDYYNHCRETAMYDVYDTGSDGSCILRDPPMKTVAYYWAAEINKKATARFKELHNTLWIATIHEGSYGNDTIINSDRHTIGKSSSYEPLEGCADCGDKGKTSFPIDSQPISSFSSDGHCFVTGIFSKSNVFFLLALNKCRDNPQKEDVTFQFKSPCAIDSFDCLKSKWISVSKKTENKKFVNIKPAEILFLKLTPQNQPAALR